MKRSRRVHSIHKLQCHFIDAIGRRTTHVENDDAMAAAGFAAMEEGDCFWRNGSKLLALAGMFDNGYKVLANRDVYCFSLSCCIMNNSFEIFNQSWDAYRVRAAIRFVSPADRQTCCGRAVTDDVGSGCSVTCRLGTILWSVDKDTPSSMRPRKLAHNGLNATSLLSHLTNLWSRNKRLKAKAKTKKKKKKKKSYL